MNTPLEILAHGRSISGRSIHALVQRPGHYRGPDDKVLLCSRTFVFCNWTDTFVKDPISCKVCLKLIARAAEDTQPTPMTLGAWIEGMGVDKSMLSGRLDGFTIPGLPPVPLLVEQLGTGLVMRVIGWIPEDGGSEKSGAVCSWSREGRVHEDTFALDALLIDSQSPALRRVTPKVEPTPASEVPQEPAEGG